MAQIKIKYLSVKREGERLEVEWQVVGTGRTQNDVIYFSEESSAVLFSALISQSIERRKEKETKK